MGGFVLCRNPAEKFLSNAKKNGRQTMSFFGKKMPKKAKQGMVKIALLVLGICAALSMPFIAALGWFASNGTTDATGMQVVASTELYDILIDRPATQFDPLELDENSQPIYPNITAFRAQLAADGYSLSALSTETASQLGFELTNEAYEADSGYNLVPGSYGALHFYLRPNAGADGSEVTLSLEFGGYANTYDEYDQLEIVPVEEEEVLDLLKGHLLFFTERTGSAENYQYDGLIENGSFQYAMDPLVHPKCSTPGKTDCYEITLYWEWPVTYEEIIENTSTTSPAVTKKYPVELADYWNDNREFFFETNANETDPVLLSDGYNDGDQRIGDTVNFITVRVY